MNDNRGKSFGFDRPKYRKREMICLIILGALFSFMSLAGVFYDVSDRKETIVSFFKDYTNSFVALFTLLLIAFIALSKRLFSTIDKSSINIVDCLTKESIPNPRKRWLKISAIIFLMWSPYIIIMFPGTTAGTDYYWQLIQGCGAFPLSNHHPVFGSLVFGVLYKVGYAVGGAYGGVFLTCLFQMMLTALVLGYSLSTLKSLGIPHKLFIFALAFFCLCPVFPTHAMWAVKDSIFSSIAVLFFFGLFTFTWSVKNDITVQNSAGIVTITISAILFSIYRNGVFVVAIITMLMPLYVFIKKNGIRAKCNIKIVASIVTLIVFVNVWNAYLDYRKVYPTNFRESCGIPSRQILRSYELRSEKFTDEQKERLEYFYRTGIDAAGSIKELAKRNGPLIADGIKPAFFTNRSEVAEYINLYIQIGLRNPEIYIDEALHGSYAYWWVGYNPEQVFHAIPLPLLHPYFEEYAYTSKPIQDYFEPIPKSLGDSNDLINKTMPEILKEEYNYLVELIYRHNLFENMSKKFQHAMYRLKEMPIISVFLAPGIYTWIALFALFYMITRKKSGGITWPVLLITLLACLSPVNGYMRYVLPVDLFSIIMICMCFVAEKDDTVSVRLENG